MNRTVEALFIGPTLIVAMLMYANLNHVNVKANRWFGTFILLIFIIELGVLFDDVQMFGQNSSISELINLASYIIAPVFYLSIVYYIEPSRKWRNRDNLHFLFGVLMLLLTILSFMVPASSAETATEKDLEETVLLVFTAAFCLQVLTYCLFAFQKITRYQQNLFTYASNTDRVSLQWLKKNVVCVIFIAVLWLVDAVFEVSEGSLVFDYTSTLLYFIGIYYIAYYGLQQKEIFPFNALEKLQLDTIIGQAQNEAEGKKKLVTDEKLADYVQMLGQLMNAEKPYLDFEISLIRLASQFNTSPHLLSYIINNGFGENFFQFVNRYRVEEAKRLILDPKMNHLNLVGIAYEAGFNSKTVFNTTFKKTTGQTPTEFKKNHNPLTFNKIPDVRIDKLEQ